MCGSQSGAISTFTAVFLNTTHTHTTSSSFVNMENDSNKFSQTKSFTVCVHLEEVENHNTERRKMTNCFTGKMYLKWMNTSEHKNNILAFVFHKQKIM